MRVINVEEMFECPFKGREVYQISEYTWGGDDICLLQDGDICRLMGCPLKKAKTIKVVWKRKD